jgi:hypothetical protein
MQVRIGATYCVVLAVSLARIGSQEVFHFGDLSTYCCRGCAWSSSGRINEIACHGDNSRGWRCRQADDLDCSAKGDEAGRMTEQHLEKTTKTIEAFTCAILLCASDDGSPN